MFWEIWKIVHEDKEEHDIVIRKGKKMYRGKPCYFYTKADNEGNIIFNSGCFASRGGRNKAVNKAASLENAKIEDD